MINIRVTNPYHNETYTLKGGMACNGEELTEDEFLSRCRSNMGGGHPIIFVDTEGRLTSIQADKFASVDIWKS